MFLHYALLFTMVALAVSITAGGLVQSKSRGVTSQTERLFEIGRKDLKKLKNLYSPDGKKSYVTYVTISNYIRWFEQNPKLTNVKFYSLNGNFSDGTFVVTDGYAVTADTLNESYDRLYRLLLLFDFSKSYVFIGVRNELKPTVNRALDELNVKITEDSPDLLYYLAKEEALKFDVKVPEGIELRPINEPHDIKKVISVYPHPRQSFPDYLQQLAKYNPNVGAFTTDGALVAWIFRYPSGLLGILQADQKYKGKGYAALVTKCLSKKVAEMGHDVYSAIIEDNKPSRSLFTKLGFKPIARIHWIDTEKHIVSS
ncbi:uncharacterized protein LOC116338095 [Contarinia nasturtii]|uniref:uncharacterized protein LOC116338095 n=1 Tax=Contarinia nasturtii TaxID=265458 RepID=UPI0012D409F3|nr:uncharacterized protein LOC116338095 [Contarinia nasturtii]